MSESNSHIIALVGGGLANTSTLYELIKDIQFNMHKIRLCPKIKIFDIRKDFFAGGEAYAGSGPEMIFTNTFDVKEIKEKVKSGELLHDLAKWLEDNKERYISKLKVLGNDKVNKWLSDNEKKLANNEFEKIHFPRVVLSWFISETLYNTLEKAKSLGVDVELVEGKVTDIYRDEERIGLSLSKGAYKIKVTKDLNGDISFSEEAPFEENDIKANDVVIATGLPPRKQFKGLELSDRYFDTQTTQEGDLRPRHELLVEQILALYERKKEPVRIGSIGLGPSFLDVVMLLDKKELEGKFILTGYSKTGMMRHNSADKAESTDYKPKFLGRIEGEKFIAYRFSEEDKFFAALDNELEQAVKEGFGPRDVEYITKLYLETIKGKTIERDKPNFSYNPDLYRVVVEKERGRVKLRNHLKLVDPNTSETAEKMMEAGRVKSIVSYLEYGDIELSDTGTFVVTALGNRQEFDMMINCSPRLRLRDAPVVDICIKKGFIDIKSNNGIDFVVIDSQNRSSEGIYLGGATAVNYERDGEVITGDVGVGAIMRHAKRISRGITEEIQIKPRSQNYADKTKI